MQTIGTLDAPTSILITQNSSSCGIYRINILWRADATHQLESTVTSTR